MATVDVMVSAVFVLLAGGWMLRRVVGRPAKPTATPAQLGGALAASVEKARAHKCH